MKFLKKMFMLLFYCVLSSVVFADFTTIELPSDFSISFKKDFSDKEIRTMYYDLKLNDKVSLLLFLMEREMEGYMQQHLLIEITLMQVLQDFI